MQAASTQKWLECHPGRHEEWFYLDYGMALQKRFLDHFLKGIDNGWNKERSVLLNIRRPFTSEVELRKEQHWPLANTQWTSMHLSASDLTMNKEPPPNSSSVTFEALGKPITFFSSPLEAKAEITGPLVANLFISLSTSDADLFVTFQAFAPDGREVEFQGTIDPHTPLAQGWLRASHRKLDPAKSLPYRPYHSHDEIQSLVPDKIYEVNVEIWPTCVVLPAGFRLALQISGHDFEREPPKDPNEAWVSRGSGPFLHTHPEDRPGKIFSGRTTIHTGGKTKSHLVLPVIAAKEAQ
jgi:predicted acyl esterase